MKKTIFSLALGTFGLGMAEFGIMGVLPEIARDVGISIPAAGNMISWYALGVVIGAPVEALFSSRFSLKAVMLFLVALRYRQCHLYVIFQLFDAGAGAPDLRFPARRLLWRGGDRSVENCAAG